MKKKFLKLFLVLALLFMTSLSADAATRSASVNTWYSGYLENYNSVNEYTYTLSSAGYISISFKHDYLERSSTYWTAQIYNSNGDIVLNRGFAGNQTETETTKIGLPAGSYRVKITDGSYHSTVTYQIRLNFTSNSNWECEINDTMGKATSLSTNTYKYGSLDDYNDIDYYKFTLNSSGYISITFKHEFIDRGSYYWNAIVYDSLGNEVLDRGFIGNQTESVTTNIGLPAGTYYIKITDSSYHSDIQYSFRINYTSNSYWEKEINNTMAKANSINTNKTYYGSLENYNDNDFYKFTLSSAGYIQISLGHEYIDSSGSYWYVCVYNSNGDIVLEDYYVGNKTSDSSIIMGIPSGTYHMKVSDYSYHNDMPYNFYVKYTASSNWEKEINDSTAKSTQIYVDTAVNGTLSDYNDKDYYKISINVSGTYKLTFSYDYFDSNYNGWTAKIMNTSGAVVFEEDFTGKLSNKTVQIYLTSGTYYVIIENSYNHVDYVYSFGLYSPNATMPFTDVSNWSWYYDAIKYVYDNELMTGLNSTTFGPDQKLARAQFAVILYRMNDEPYVSYSAKFPDVARNTWYTSAVLWANKIGVINGYDSNGYFGPSDNINREQIATMMYRYAKYKGYSVSQTSSLYAYSDRGRVNSFAYDAMRWAVGKGIITGKNGGTILDPQGNATRAECATIIMRFLEKYE